MNFISLFKKTKNNTDLTTQRETKVLYSNREIKVTEGIELPKNWSNLSSDELRIQVKNAILELSKSSNSDYKAKELGFKDAKHLIDLCFNFILK